MHMDYVLFVCYLVHGVAFLRGNEACVVEHSSRAIRHSGATKLWELIGSSLRRSAAAGHSSTSHQEGMLATSVPQNDQKFLLNMFDFLVVVINCCWVSPVCFIKNLVPAVEYSMKNAHNRHIYVHLLPIHTFCSVFSWIFSMFVSEHQ